MSMIAQNYAISHFLKIWSYNNLPLNPRFLIINVEIENKSCKGLIGMVEL